MDERELAQTLRRLDGRSFKAYKDLRGRYAFAACELFIDHVQGDPFAAPSKLRLRVPMAEARLPTGLFATRSRRIALADALAREVARAIPRSEGGAGSGKSGTISIDCGGQEVLERSAVRIQAGGDTDLDSSSEADGIAAPGAAARSETAARARSAGAFVEARLEVGLPGAGRRVLGAAAERLLVHALPGLAARALCWPSFPPQVRAALEAFVDCVDDQEHMRAQLAERELLAFVADGSLLPRESGASDRPMSSDAALPFVSPPELAIELERLAGRGSVRGMGIPRGVTLIVGGGYHGKSTLLRALERGVYPHIPGDGREAVVTDAGVVKVRAEDGRATSGVDIEAFVRELPSPAIPAAPGHAARPQPLARSTRHFSTRDASGSTSQAASIAEAIEAGCSALLLDEDTSATNFMLRDARMQALIAREHEPITPFVERVRELWHAHGISTVLVMGGSGDYFDVADRVISLCEYAASDVSAEARRIALAQPTGRELESPVAMRSITSRVPVPGGGGFDASSGRRDVKIQARGHDQLVYGREEIDLRAVEQLVDASQTRAIGLAIWRASRELVDGRRSLREILSALDAQLDAEGLDPLDPHGEVGEHPGRLARPRRFEIAAAINRMRSLRTAGP